HGERGRLGDAVVGGGDGHGGYGGHRFGRNHEGYRGGIGGYGYCGRHRRRIEVVARQRHDRAAGRRRCAERHCACATRRAGDGRRIDGDAAPPCCCRIHG